MVRVYRGFFEARTTLINMWRGNPVLTALVFGLPLGFLSLICYSICCADILDADEEEVTGNSFTIPLLIYISQLSSSSQLTAIDDYILYNCVIVLWRYRVFGHASKEWVCSCVHVHLEGQSFNNSRTIVDDDCDCNYEISTEDRRSYELYEL